MRRKHSHDVVSGGVAQSSAPLDGVRCTAGSGQVLDGGWRAGWWMKLPGFITSTRMPSFRHFLIFLTIFTVFAVTCTSAAVGQTGPEAPCANGGRNPVHQAPTYDFR
ncbi:hypothetical protein VC83_02999 [Pseudogymnoascus destructans]|uniref:Uncharacterized protein n=2 Tax=Pseudogymnoascus destructans TaxID=655981 RepID=L8GBG6_PSED2|nr:uncharacterized protein VC83_02999 [Pseudogymnoascus destructans]ELR10204.1 hypothetical protein GMDG_04597 [Pseudogymnoascus destructans 20631-21]OAF60063.1 hypothetical protein VC83_02999 [Pseudogymnoascus destructans]